MTGPRKSRSPAAQTAKKQSSSAGASGSEGLNRYDPLTMFKYLENGETVSDRCPSKSSTGLDCQKGDCYTEHITLTHRNHAENNDWLITREDKNRWQPKNNGTPTESGDLDGLDRNAEQEYDGNPSSSEPERDPG